MTVRRLLEWAVVIVIALGLHVAVFLRIPSGAVGDAGAEGTASVSLQAMTPHLAAMIARVDLAEEIITPEAVEASEAPTALAAAATEAEVRGTVAPPERAAVEPSNATPERVSVTVQALEASGPQASTAITVPSVSAEAAAAIALAPSEPVDAEARGPAQTAASASVMALAPAASQEPDAVQSPERMEPSAPISAIQSDATSPRRADPSPTTQQIAALRSVPIVAPSVSEPVAPTDPGSEPAISPVEARSALAPEASPQPPRRPERQLSQPQADPSPPDQTAAAPRAAQRAPASAQETGQHAAPREQAQQRALGAGGGAQAGTARAGTPSISEAQRSNLMARWGGQIRSRIERRKPRGSVGRGTVTLRISIANDGRLAGVAVARSSGNATLDTAAVQAVQRAGRFPRAPRGLPSGPHAFTLPVQFAR